MQIGLQNALSEKKYQLENFFQLRTLNFIERKGTYVQWTVVYVSDLSNVINEIKHQCHITHARNHLGLDDKGGFLKFCLNVTMDCDSLEQPPVKKKVTIGRERFKDSGVKKVFVIGIVPDIKENYHNVSQLILVAGISSIQFSLGMDIKIANIICWLMAHSSKHPCCWCEVSNDYDINETVIPRRRTLGRICELTTAYKRDVQAAAAAAQKMSPMPQDKMNCINMPLFNLADDLEVMDLAPPKELHLMLCVTTKLYDALSDGMKDDGDDSKRIESEHIIKKGYRGGSMEGSKCTALLKKAMDLEKELLDKYKIRHYGPALQYVPWKKKGHR